MDLEAKKTVLRRLVYGLYVVGVRRAEESHATTVSWLAQCSFEPPMLVVALEVESRTLPLVREAGAFVVSVLPVGARQVASKLGRASADVADKLMGLAHRSAPLSGAPIPADATGWLECRVTNELPAGDHVLVVAEVIEAGVQREAETLTLGETGFRYAG